MNGKIYRDDTTILAWDIANEVEFYRFDPVQVRDWIHTIAAYVKSLDPNHPVTIGVAMNSNEYDKDGAAYDMLDVPELDFFSFHYYVVPTNWDDTKPLGNYVQQTTFRTQKLLSMGKPAVLEEFGFSPSGRLNLQVRSDPSKLPLYLQVYKETMDTAFTTGASGVLFWAWGAAEGIGI